MVAGGIIAEDERIELIGGEVVPMSPKGNRHEVLRTELVFHLARLCPPTLRVASETPLRLAVDEFVEPDLLVYPKTIPLPDVRGDGVLLVVEIADSSLAYDHNMKATLYAAHGVREYWVINARTLVTRVHRGPAASGYVDTSELAADEQLTPHLAPGLVIRLNDLDLG